MCLRTQICFRIIIKFSCFMQERNTFTCIVQEPYAAPHHQLYRYSTCAYSITNFIRRQINQYKLHIVRKKMSSCVYVLHRWNDDAMVNAIISHCKRVYDDVYNTILLFPINFTYSNWLAARRYNWWQCCWKINIWDMIGK